MEYREAMKLIIDELERAEKKHPGWPEDVVHQAAIVAEEAGELVKCSIDRFYAGGDMKDVVREASQVGAMGLRFLLNCNKEDI